MKIATWNVNSIKVRAEQVKKWLLRAEPDVLCLQELKTTADQFPFGLFEEIGYTAAISAQKTYNGVAILARGQIGDVEEGLSHLPEKHPLNEQKRLLCGTVNGVRVISAYMPNGEATGSEKYPYKLEFFREFRNLLDRRRSPAEKLVVCGDFNVATEDIDLYNPSERAGEILCSGPERAALENIKNFGLADCFRIHNKEAGRYTWWDYQGGMFWKGLGMRLDLILATKPLAESCVACDADLSPRKWPRPSDHTVVWADFKLS